MREKQLKKQEDKWNILMGKNYLMGIWRVTDVHFNAKLKINSILYYVTL